MCPFPQPPVTEYVWANKESKQVMDVVERLVAGMVNELAGQSKVSVTRPNNELQSLSFELPFKRLPLMDFLEASAQRTFPADSFAETNNTGVLLELTYRTVLDGFTDPSSVFPYSPPRPLWRGKWRNGATKFMWLSSFSLLWQTGGQVFIQWTCTIDYWGGSALIIEQFIGPSLRVAEVLAVQQKF